MRYSFFLLVGGFFAASPVLDAQQLQFTAFTGLAPAAEITFAQTAAGAALTSGPSPVFEIGLDYYQKLYRRWGLVAGIYGGMQSHFLKVGATPAFLGTELAPDHRHRTFASPHLGARVLADYRLLDKGRHRLSAATGVGAYSIADYSLTEVVSIISSEPFQGNDKTYYTSLTRSNNARAIRFRPEFRLNWQYALASKMALNVFVAGAYSNLAFQNATFDLIGANEQASGAWLTKFQQTGIGFGLCRRW